MFVIDCSAVSMSDEQEPSQMAYQEATTQQLHSADPRDWQRSVDSVDLGLTFVVCCHLASSFVTFTLCIVYRGSEFLAVAFVLKAMSHLVYSL